MLFIYFVAVVSQASLFPLSQFRFTLLCYVYRCLGHMCVFALLTFLVSREARSSLVVLESRLRSSGRAASVLALSHLSSPSPTPLLLFTQPRTLAHGMNDATHV